eukprot:TRINITY_DN23566_c0_g1_i1.p1 TRINITY_DN23566_c0_g1~~TRINITY_DN23566_c0_g1_i1.p1  ORF type:complete len:169 (-),score=11.06 TRINITY_DN23566_c0_g1_i1:56-562(-)
MAELQTMLGSSLDGLRQDEAQKRLTQLQAYRIFDSSRAQPQVCVNLLCLQGNITKKEIAHLAEKPYKHTVIKIFKITSMKNLKTTYMGIELDNPIILGACNMSKHLDVLKKAEENGVAAIVYRSLFEEQIQLERLQMDEKLAEFNDIYPCTLPCTCLLYTSPSPRDQA